MQEKLNRAHHNARRKLFNSSLDKLGNKTAVIFIDTEILNMYRDKRYIPTDSKTITCYLDLPRDEVELFGTGNDRGTAGFNILDVLPRYAWSSFENQLSVDDYLLRQVWVDATKFILQIFQITKVLAKSKTFVQQVRYLLAPVNVLEGVEGDNQLEMALSSLIEDYRSDELPHEGETIPVPESTDESDFVENPFWYNDGKGAVEEVDP